jgi:hypothetical protein
MDSPPTSDAPVAPDMCLACGKELPAGAQVCTLCGRKQYRLCLCGTELAPHESICPECGADWVSNVRVRRRSRSKRVRPSRMAPYAFAGAVAFLIVVSLLKSLVDLLARVGGLPASQHAGPLGELYYAWVGLGQAGSVLWERSVQAGVQTLLALALVGAAAGCVWYIIRLRALPAHSARHRPSSNRTKRRRKRVT